MKYLYEKLYEDIWPVAKGPLSELTSFSAIKGKQYRPGGLMLVGRCANGWSLPIMEESAERFGTAMASLFVPPEIEGDGFSCIQEAGGRYFFGDSLAGEHWLLSRSAFWRIARGIFEQVERPSVLEGRWFENIVWSNVLKISPKSNGNPNAALRNAQFPACLEILKEEIAQYRPGHVLMVTGDWFFPNKMGAHPSFCETFSMHRKEGGHVYATGSYQGTLIIVSNRPEYKNEAEFRADVCRYF